MVGVSRPGTVAGVTRLAVLMSHYYGAEPVAVHVARGEAPTWEARVDLQGERLFEIARSEARELGYSLRTYSEFSSDIAAGILRAADDLEPHVLILGESAAGGTAWFASIAKTIASSSSWPLILTRFDACSHRGKAIAAVRSSASLERVRPLLDALQVGGCTTVVADSPTADSVRDLATDADLVIVSADDDPSVPLASAGTLAGDLAAGGGVPMLMVCGDLRARS
jgi:hypothetical protein